MTRPKLDVTRTLLCAQVAVNIRRALRAGLPPADGALHHTTSRPRAAEAKPKNGGRADQRKRWRP